MNIEIEKFKLKQLLREIRHAYLEGFKSGDLTRKSECDAFESSVASKVIDSYSKEFNVSKD